MLVWDPFLLCGIHGRSSCSFETLDFEGIGPGHGTTSFFVRCAVHAGWKATKHLPKILCSGTTCTEQRILCSTSLFGILGANRASGRDLGDVFQGRTELAHNWTVSAFELVRCCSLTDGL